MILYFYIICFVILLHLIVVKIQKLTVESDELQSYEILRKGGESVRGYNGNIHQHDSKSYKENNQVSNIKHHLEDDDVYLFL